MWNNVRSAFHNAAIDPADVLDLLDGGMPVEDNDDAVYYTMPWAIEKVAPLTGRPGRGAAAAPRRVAWSCSTAPQPGSTIQLAAFQAADQLRHRPGLLRAWLAGRDLPARHRARPRPALARPGPAGDPRRGRPGRASTRRLADEPTARSRVEHARATASLPDEEAKAWAWQRFTGEVDVPNYELEAAGLGMWRVGQELLTEPYVDRYFDELPGTVDVRQGWVLATPPSRSSRSPR